MLSGKKKSKSAFIENQEKRSSVHSTVFDDPDKATLPASGRVDSKAKAKGGEYLLQVTIKEGRKMVAPDIGNPKYRRSRVADAPDAYVEATTMGITMRTFTEENMARPRWNEPLMFTLLYNPDDDKKHTMALTLYDHFSLDKIDVMIGKYTVLLRVLLRQQLGVSTDQWVDFQLEGPDGADVTTAEVNIAIEVLKFDASKMPASTVSASASEPASPATPSTPAGGGDSVEGAKKKKGKGKAKSSSSNSVDILPDDI